MYAAYVKSQCLHTKLSSYHRNVNKRNPVRISMIALLHALPKFLYLNDLS